MKKNVSKLLFIGSIWIVGCVETQIQPPPPPVKTPNLSIESDYYSLKLNWNYQNADQITGVKIYRGESKNKLEELITIPNTSEYIDHLVGVRKVLYYTIVYQLSDGSLSTSSDTLSQLPKEPINTTPTTKGEIGGVHYVWWKFQSNTFKTLTNTFTIHSEPSNKDGLFYTMYQGFINGQGFYFGIQNQVFPKRTKGLIFSRWGTRDTTNYQIAEGGWGQSAGYEGDFIGVRKEYEWTVGTYQTVLKQDSTVNNGDWYSVVIQKLPNGEKVYMGSIRFEKSNIHPDGIKSGGVSWTEIYLKEKTNGEVLSWYVSMDEIKADNNEKPISADIMYAEKVFTQVSNTFTRGKGDIHFIMGPEVKRFHKPRKIFF